MSDAKAMRNALFAHVDRCFPVHDKAFVDLGEHPLVARLPALRIVRVTPSYGTEPWVFLSSGAWPLGTEERSSVELLLLANDEDPRHASALASILQRLGRPAREGEVVSAEGAWGPGATCTEALVTLPYPYGPTLETVEGAPWPTRYLWLCPVTPAEGAFARAAGAEALEQRLEGADIRNPRRPSRV